MIREYSTPLVMSIINSTPDSFYPGSRNVDRDQLAQTIASAVREGADILDIGGYSSRPGAEDVSAAEEFRRLDMAMDIIRSNHPDIAVSVDTFRAEVAYRVIARYGKCIVNDISAGELDGGMLDMVAEAGVPYIAMHMRSTPAEMQRHTDYNDINHAVLEYLRDKIDVLKSKGINDIILDPGFGFAKTTQQNYQLLAGLDSIVELGYPVLSGISRKSMIYKVLDSAPEDALAGTVALNWESLKKGASLIRVHDTREAVQVVKLFKYYKMTVGHDRG